MAFPVFGNPLPTFLDSNGDPLASGTLTIVEPTDDTHKNTYPTADDADAGTNPNTGAITLNSRGEPGSTGLFGVDNEKYKATLKDSSGTTIWTIDDIQLPTVVPTLYGKTAQTLTDAGAVTLTESTTFLVTTGAAAITLADGTENQHKYIVMKTAGGTATLTPTNFGNGTTVSFGQVGDSADLFFANGSWHWMGGTATLNGSTAVIEDKKVKTADETVTSSATLQDDDHLAGFSLEAATFYEFTGFLKVNSGASSTPDIQFTLQTDNAFQDGVFAFTNVNDAGTIDNDTGITPVTVVDTPLVANQVHGIHINGFVYTHATLTSTVDFRWAQDTSNATATTIELGSWLKFKKLA